MTIEEGGPLDYVLEDCSDEEDEWCPVCEEVVWLRLIAAYQRGTCWVLFCAGCGRTFKEKWTLL